LRGGWTFPQPSSRSIQTGKSARFDRCFACQRQRARSGIRWRWRPTGRGHTRRQNYLSRPPVDVVRGGCIESQSRCGNYFRHQIHTQPIRVDTQAWRQADVVEDRTLAIESQDAGDRRAARGGNERSYIFQGTLVWLRRRALRRSALAGNLEQG
jgi:hypothetical protein